MPLLSVRLDGSSKMQSRAEGFCLLREWRVLAHDNGHKKQKEDLWVLCSAALNTHKTKKDDPKSSSFFVGAKGFEPLTLCL